ncbi:MAG: hypothetical protein KC776_35765 [Myxococcales bacterium]|nr:hypothetical protein [Myxococcales bacterium]MCB9578571.1 hypothetical protein [Polyangiaceae bacterium]
MTFSRALLGAVLGIAVLTLPAVAAANDRHFTYTYETAVLPPGARELEVWTTWRAGRERYYSRFDHRLELEVGVAKNLMTSLYINFTGLTEEDDTGQRASEFEYEGVSNEWKLKLSDPVADAVGFGLYGEVTAAPSEYEAEAKLLFDKRVGDVLIAMNLVGESEWKVQKDETETELAVTPVAGVSYIVNPSFSAGVEIQNENVIEEGELEHSVLSAGPVISYSTETWWTTLTFLPQITDFKKGGIDDEAHERVQVRLLLSSHL